jgi:pimeloyl-ACP methyl ester carboxylesterase
MSSIDRAPPQAAETFAARMTDGVEVLVRRYGIGNGPCLAISHGNGFAVDGYRVFWEPLIERFELALFDMRNHGRNPPSGADGHNYLQLSLDIGSVQEQLRAKLEPGQALVGAFHSMSARAAQKHAIERGWGWDALVLFDPPSMPPRNHALFDAMRAFEKKLIDWACERPDQFDSPEGMVQSYRESRASRGWQPQAIGDMGRAVVRADGNGGWTLACRRELEAAIYLAALTLDLWPKASAHGGPVLLVGADPNVPNSPPTGKANRALATENGYAYEAIAQSGHMLQVEKPAACREAMLRFLRAHHIG